MNHSYSAAQLEQFRRDAKRLARQTSIPHHEALDQVAARKGARNWSLLAKHSVASAAAPASPTATSPSMPAQPEGSDRRVRYYLHGDEVEGDPTKFYCAQCDLFVVSGHFFAEHPRKVTLARCSDALERWRRLPAAQRARHRRPAGAANMLESLAVAAAAAHEASRSPFHRWLEQQKGRNDPIGDLAGDVLSDEEFPVTANSLKQVRRYVESQGAFDSVIEALNSAWIEFRGTSQS